MDIQVYDGTLACENVGMLGFEYSLWSVVAFGGTLDVVVFYSDRVKAGMVSDLLGINDEVDERSRSLGKIDNDGKSLGAMKKGHVIICTSNNIDQ